MEVLMFRFAGRVLRPLLWLFLLGLLVPSWALAVPSARHLIFPTTQVWVLVIGALVPLVTYVVNHVGPWVSEPVKAFVLVLAAGIAGALETALSTNVFGWNDATLQLVLSAVVAAFAAHGLIWRPSGVSVILGGGSNRTRPARGHRAHPAQPPGPTTV